MKKRCLSGKAAMTFWMRDGAERPVLAGWRWLPCKCSCFRRLRTPKSVECRKKLSPFIIRQTSAAAGVQNLRFPCDKQISGQTLQELQPRRSVGSQSEPLFLEKAGKTSNKSSKIQARIVTGSLHSANATAVALLSAAPRLAGSFASPTT